MRDIIRDPKYKIENAIPLLFHEGDYVCKEAGDYIFYGIIVSVFRKRSGAPRYVVENEDGILHIFSSQQLTFFNPPQHQPTAPAAAFPRTE